MSPLPKSLTQLKTAVESLQHEIETAVAFHETWLRMVEDRELHGRVGASHAGNTFIVIRVALQREMLLALARMWDTNPQSLSCVYIIKKLFDNKVFNELMEYTYNIYEEGDEFDKIRNEEIKKHVLLKRDELKIKISGYEESGEKFSTLEKIKSMRNGLFAHRQVFGQFSEQSFSKDEINTFLSDMKIIASLARSLILREAISFEDTASVYRHYAYKFWRGVVGERTPGHPDYRQPISYETE